MHLETPYTLPYAGFQSNRAVLLVVHRSMYIAVSAKYIDRQMLVKSLRCHLLSERKQSDC